MTNTHARERVLRIAEQLFMERGYSAVSMSDLAEALGMQKASLYHHAVEGKEALFVEVMVRVLQRYRQGLESAIHQAGSSFEAKLRAAAHWLLESPSLHYERMMQSDMPNLNIDHAQRLQGATYAALINPLIVVFEPEMRARGVDTSKVVSLAGAFLLVIEGVHNLPEHFGTVPKSESADFLVETLFKSFGMA